MRDPLDAMVCEMEQYVTMIGFEGENSPTQHDKKNNNKSQLTYFLLTLVATTCHLWVHFKVCDVYFAYNCWDTPS